MNEFLVRSPGGKLHRSSKRTCVRASVRASAPGVTTPGAATKWIPKSKKCKKRFENECLVRSPGELLEALNWTMKTQKAFPCSVALVTFFAGAFPCSVALVF